eukprot:6196979-Pleurochrysis_carterae.AAC.4
MAKREQAALRTGGMARRAIRGSKRGVGGERTRATGEVMERARWKSDIGVVKTQFHWPKARTNRHVLRRACMKTCSQCMGAGAATVIDVDISGNSGRLTSVQAHGIHAGRLPKLDALGVDLARKLACRRHH